MFATRKMIVLSRHIVRLVAVVALTCIAFSQARAQRYETIPVKLEAREGKQLAMTFATALRNPAGFGASQADVEKYLKQYYFPLMTSTSPDVLGVLAGERTKLLKQYIPQTVNPTSQQYLIDMTFNVARVLARGNYHPAVRYNAVLMLGELDQQISPPVPYAKSATELLELVEQQEFNKIPVPESVKLAAILGLERHARYGIDPQLADRLTKAMLAVMTSPTPDDVEAGVHDWVRAAAAKVLAVQYAKGPTKEVQAALTAFIADSKTSLDDRCTVAAALKGITYAPGSDVDGAATTDALAGLALDVVTDGAKLARDYQKQALSGANFSSMREGGYGRGSRRYGGGGEYGGGRYSDQDTGPRFEKREVFARLYDVGLGARSLKAGLADIDKGRVDALIAEMTPVLNVMEDKNATEVDISSRVIELEASLKSLIQSWGKPEGVAAN